ncbi:MAG: ParA family protein [Verrucomicrobiales bacterium]|nr:ParA family protein [Verrucomicrobiae bacterium]
MRIIAVANQKGGVGKTTTSMNLAACLAERGVRVLLLDLDPQANASSALGYPPQPGGSLYPVLLGEDWLEGKIVQTRFPSLSIIPSEMELAGIEIELARAENHLTRLAEVLAPLRNDGRFDYMIIDCPPSLGILMTSALAAADGLLIPIQCEYFGLEGLAKIVEIHEQITQSDINPNVTIEGILMTMYDSRTNLSKSVVEDVRRVFGDLVYKTIIPRSVSLSEAPSYEQSIIEYAPSSRGAVAYRELAKEFLKRAR